MATGICISGGVLDLCPPQRRYIGSSGTLEVGEKKDGRDVVSKETDVPSNEIEDRVKNEDQVKIENKVGA